MCITLTEPQGGSDLANVVTSAVKSADGRFFIVNGQKKFITGGTVCDFFSTLVRTGGKGISGTSLLMIEKQYKGVTVRKLKAQVNHSTGPPIRTHAHTQTQASAPCTHTPRLLTALQTSMDTPVKSTRVSSRNPCPPSGAHPPSFVRLG